MDKSNLDSHERQNLNVYKGVMGFMLKFAIVIAAVLLLMAFFLL